MRCRLWFGPPITRIGSRSSIARGSSTPGSPSGSTIDERNALVHPLDLPVLMRALRTGRREVDFRLRRRSDGMYRWHSALGTLCVRRTCRFIASEPRWTFTISGSQTRCATGSCARSPRCCRIGLLDRLPRATRLREFGDAHLYGPSLLKTWVSVGAVHASAGLGADQSRTRQLDRDRRALRDAASSASHDGPARWFLSRALPMRGPGGEIVRWFGTSTDIDERKAHRSEQTYLAELGRIVNSSLDLDRTLRHICDAAFRCSRIRARSTF